MVLGLRNKQYPLCQKRDKDCHSKIRKTASGKVCTLQYSQGFDQLWRTLRKYYQTVKWETPQGICCKKEKGAVENNRNAPGRVHAASEVKARSAQEDFDKHNRK